jgi:ATP-dependent Zn protease
MRECCCGVDHRRPEQFEDCLRRAAYHEAGHALALCLVYLSDPEKDSMLLNCLTISLETREGGRFPLPEGQMADPWTDALIQLGGPAAEELMYAGEVRKHHSADEDWLRAERLLRNLGMRRQVGDAFEIAKELLHHHRTILEALTQDLLQCDALTGARVWEVVATSLGEDAPPVPVHSQTRDARSRELAHPT